MAHHKRRRPKHQRAGCLLCKPHKDERVAQRDHVPVPRPPWFGNTYDPDDPS